MLPRIIFFYISRKFLKSILLFSILVIFLIILIDFSESVRRFSDTSNDYMLFLLNSIFRIPWIVIQITPFLILFAAFYTIRDVVLKRELDIYKASGISVWQFLQPFLIITLLWSLLTILVISPLNTISIPYQNKLNALLSKKGNQEFINSGNNIIWIVYKEPNFAEKIILAQRGKIKNDIFYFDKVSVIDLHKNILTNSLIAKSGTLAKQTLSLNSVITYNAKEKFPQKLKKLVIPLNLNQSQLRSLSAEPSEIFIWAVPTFIKALQLAGISTASYAVYFFDLLTLPFLLFSMIFISMRFSLYDVRSGKRIYAIFLTIVFGFFIFLLTNIIGSLASLEIIKPFILILLSKLIIMLITINILFAKEGY
ncbi:LPS export ABC transporter permease LptG [Candidatus Hepatincola sp. Pdp]